ncbi:MAG: ABC transporter ATP-binding protein [Clostridiales bacterium]|nr:ABC transporter ATP-binding protein [Clostridiales bacterium]MCF8023024.1 ABC transporter ATP-binding protein [Clostridiales bacterium]
MIHIENIAKYFQELEVLKDIDLHVEQGTIFGLVGPNGAGKTTLIQIMMGILIPDKGQVITGGQNVQQNPAIKNSIGYVADYQSYYPNFKVRDMIKLYRKTYKNWNQERFAELYRIFELPEDKKVKKLSKGMRTQLAVLLNLSINPSVLVLDEPTSGLDPVLRRQLLNILMDEAAQNKTTVFISTHNLNELERICDHIGFIYQGQVVFNDRLEEMKENIRKIQAAFTEDLPEEFMHRKEFLKVEKHGRVYSFVLKENTDGIMTELEQYRPILLETIDMSLEDIFVYRMEGLGYDFNQFAAQ